MKPRCVLNSGLFGVAFCEGNQEIRNRMCAIS